MNSVGGRQGLPAGGASYVEKRYVKKKDIKKSLYGVVYLALDTRTNQEVVIKSSDRVLALTKTLMDGSPSKEDIEEEIRIHRKLSNDPEPSPYIIKLLDVVWTKETIDLVLEYAPGGDLFSVIKDKTGKLNQELNELRGLQEYNHLLHKHWEEVLKLMKQILQATAYLHARNISHRDLSLENIILDSDGNIRLIDFGNAREYSDTNWLSERGPIGKSGYLSPECYAREFYDGRDNDMWCIGVILWQMLIGHKLWFDPDVADPRFKHVYFQGLQGLQKLLTHWNLKDRLPPYCSDFLVKIFCPQKCRLTVKEALEHPFITSATPSDDFSLRQVPVQISMQPDYHLKQLAHRTRYETVDIPESWVVLDPEKREKIIEHLAQVSKNRRSTVLDRSVVLAVAKKSKLDVSATRAIIHYLWASSQHPSQVQFTDHKRTKGNFDVNTRKQDVRRRGYDVDKHEDQKCDLSIEENFGGMPSTSSSAPCDRRMSEVRRGHWNERSSVKPAAAERNWSALSKVDRQKSIRSPVSNTRKTHNRMGGILASSRRASKSINAQEKSVGRRSRRRERCLSAGNEINSKLFEKPVEGDEPRGVRRNSHINRSVHHVEDHTGVARNREKKNYRSTKQRKPSTRDSMFSCTALAEV
jgi:serine/threonine protein kinase